MDIGTSLMITLANNLNTDGPKTYRSKVIDLNETEMMIDYPMNKEEYIGLPIQVNHIVEIEYIAQGSVMKFPANVKRIVESPLLAFVIDRPTSNIITKIQRREYVRINIDVDVAIHSISETFAPFTTVTRDISGGGMAVVTPGQISLINNEVVDVYFVLKSRYSDIQYIKTEAEIIRTTFLNELQHTSLRFNFDDERKRQTVIKYCFEIQREKLKKQVYK